MRGREPSHAQGSSFYHKFVTASDAAFHHMLDLPQSLTQDLSFFRVRKLVLKKTFQKLTHVAIVCLMC